ncbi:MAG: hypothetical protein IJ158_04460 [Treponema sp.]|nr:hypothetical protein [Treponema sp.]
MIYTIPILFIFISSIITVIVTGGTIGGTIDIPSFFVMFTTLFTMLIASNSVKDFFRALKIVVSKKDYSALQIAQSLNAVSLVITSVVVVCGMIACLSIAMLLAFLDDTPRFGPVVALGLLTLFYMGEMLLILIPVKSILYKKLSAFKRSPTNDAFVFSKIPAKPYISFVAGLIVLFLLLSIQSTFLLSDYPPRLLSFVPAMLLFLVAASILLLVPAKLFRAYLTALKLSILPSASEQIAQLAEARRAVNFVILIRFALAACGGVLLMIGTLNRLDDVSQIPFEFSIPLLLAAVSFLSALFLLIVRARIEKAVNFRLYGDSNDEE